MKEPFYQFYTFYKGTTLKGALEEAAKAIDSNPSKTIETMGGATIISCHASENEATGWSVEILTRDYLRPQTSVSEPVVQRWELPS